MGKRGRELELCKEWGDGTYGSNYDDWLEQKVIAVERDLAARDAQLAALGPWTVQTLRQYVADTSDGFECETGCDSYGHTELCPVTNTVQAFRLLRERLAALEQANKEGWETATQENDVAFQAVQKLKAAQERLAEAEQLLRGVLETTPVDEHGHQWGMRGLKEYFAKHSPFFTCHCGLTTDKRHIHAEDGHTVYLPDKEQP